MVFVIVPAAGSGHRFGGKQKKQFLPLVGTPVLIHTLRRFQHASPTDEIVCVVPKEDLTYATQLISQYPLSKVKRILTGGRHRQDSVSGALSLLEKTGRPDDIVLVHDAMRPLVTDRLISQIVEGVKKFGAAVAAVPVTDSLKTVSEAGDIQNSLQRDRIWAMQTPQGFRLSVLAEASRKGAADHFFATDEAMLGERLGVRIHCIEGLSGNIKVTNATDLKMAEFLLQNRKDPNPFNPTNKTE